MNVRYRVTLSTSERAQLVTMVLGGKLAVRKLKRAQILLAADGGSTDEQIAKNVAVGTSTVYRTKQRFVEQGLERALNEAPRAGAERKFDVNDEALLIAVACSKPPDERARWTLHLLAEEMVRLTTHESISDETIRRRLNELDLKPWQEKMWCIPKVDAEFVARMEDILSLYAEPADERTPVVCFDETPRQLIGEERVPIPAEPGQRARYDYEYVRNGTANVFMFVDVNQPWRHAKVTDRRTREHAPTSPTACATVPASFSQRESVDCATPVSLASSSRTVRAVRRVVRPSDFGVLQSRETMGPRSPVCGRWWRTRALRPPASCDNYPGTGGDRGDGPPVPRPTNPRPVDPDRRGCEVGAAPQPRGRPHRVALHGRPGSREARRRLSQALHDDHAASVSGCVNPSDPLWCGTSFSRARQPTRQQIAAPAAGSAPRET